MLVCRSKIAVGGVVLLVATLGATPGANAVSKARENMTDSTSQLGPDVTSLAADRRISLSEAEVRIGWQTRANALWPSLPDRLGTDFGGLWIDPDDGDRVKLALTTTASDSAHKLAHELLASADLSMAADVVTVPTAEAQLKALFQSFAAQLKAVNDGASGDIFVQLSESRNAVEVIIPTRAPLARAQRVFLSSLAGKTGVVITHEDLEPQRQGCNASGLLSCDPPFRGGTSIRASSPDDPFVHGCTAGFYATSKSDGLPYFITAGHCFGDPPRTDILWTVTGNNANGSTRTYGTMHSAAIDSYGDYGSASINGSSGWDPHPWVAVLDRADTSQDLQYYIVNDTDPADGTRVCYTGAYSRNTDCGTVTNNYFSFQGAFYARANYCGTISGDSGAPIYGSHTAYGIHVISFSTCDKLYTRISSAEYRLRVNVVHGGS